MSKWRRILAATACVSLCGAGAVTAGSITGKITYDDRVPKLASDVAAECGKVPTTQKTKVVVRLKEPPAGGSRPWPVERPVFVLSNCSIEPRVMTLKGGQPAGFRNSDDILHNLVSRDFNIGMPPSVAEKSVTLSVPGFHEVKCDVHPWMTAYVAVMSHPYFAVVSPGESFQFKDLPAGSYEVEAWHERLGTRSRKLALDGDQDLFFDISY